MKQICGMERLSGGRFLVCLEDGTAFPLGRKELEELDLHADGALTKQQEQRIFEELLPRAAKLCAMDYLQRMDRTEAQLRKKLEDLRYPPEAVEQAVEYVKGYRYIDDVRYAVNYMEHRRDSRSLRLMEQELCCRRGVSREDFRKALLEVEAPEEEGQIAEWMEKKHFAPERAERAETERMMRFLLRRGYSLSAIRRVMERRAEDPAESLAWDDETGG